jgi:hypothetical protein
MLSCRQNALADLFSSHLLKIFGALCPLLELIEEAIDFLGGGFVDGAGSIISDIGGAIGGLFSRR